MDVSKKNKLRAATLIVADSNYAVDFHALYGFALGMGFDSIRELEKYLKADLGDEYPTSIPDSFCYAAGM